MAQKITYWLLISLVISLGFGQLLRFDYFLVPIYLHDILVVTILVLLATNFVKNKVYNFVFLPGFMVFILGLFLSTVRAITLYPLSSLLVPSLYTFRLLAYLALFFALKHSKVFILTKYFYISALVSVCIGLSQYLLMPDMRIFQYLGWDDHLSRLILPHFDPTFTGVMFGLSLLSIVPLSSLLSLITIASILLTYSRSVWLSLVISLGFYIKPKKYIFFLIPVLLVAIFLLPKRFGEGTNLLRTYSISSRLKSDISYIQKYKWDFLIGRGMNTLILETGISKYDNHASGPNNSYLYLLTTTGLLGLVGWGIFMFSLYQRSLYKPMLIFFFIASLFNNVMFYPFALLWVLIIESQSKS